MEKHPNNTSARVVLGRVYQGQGKIQEAANELKKVLELDPENLMAHSLLGSIYMEKADHQAAIEEYQKILTLNPDDEETQTALRQAIEKAAGEPKATNPPNKKEQLSQDKKTPSNESTATLTLAELYLKQGHFDKATEVFRELLARDPQNLLLRQKLAEVVDRQQKESMIDQANSKLKRSEFIKPPDQKEDILEEARFEAKTQGKAKKEDDSKFTNDDILQVMRRGGKDDLVVEDKKKRPDSKIGTQHELKSALSEKKAGSELQQAQIDDLKGVLVELSSIEGIIRCFVTGNDGITIVSMGETSNNAVLGKQASVIFDSTNRSVAQLNQGKLQQVLVTAESGHILLVSFAAYVLVVLANGKINLGLLRLALESATKKLDRIL